MSPLAQAELNLRAALQLQQMVRDTDGSIREDAAKAVLEARAEVAAARAALAMQPKSVRS